MAPRGPQPRGTDAGGRHGHLTHAAAHFVRVLCAVVRGLIYFLIEIWLRGAMIDELILLNYVACCIPC